MTFCLNSKMFIFFGLFINSKLITISPRYFDFFGLNFFSNGNDNTSVGLFLFLKSLFSFLIFLLFESKIVRFIFLPINLYFLEKILK